MHCCCSVGLVVGLENSEKDGKVIMMSIVRQN